MPEEFTAGEEKLTGRTHTLPGEWLESRLIAWFMRESGSRCWVCFQYAENGAWRYWSKVDGTGPQESMRDYARRVVAYLNRELNHRGAWIGGWMDQGFSRFYLLWKDRDGDIQFPIDTAGHIKPKEIMAWPIEKWGEHGEAAYRSWRIAMEAIDAQPNQQIKLAQGQTRPN